ncbi:MAG: HAD family phosphatase [Polyangiaceae bacterium]|nr:HAD family phosphatase [Polyangiaceae bacterium]
MSYRLLVTDLDGTLLDSSGCVHARDAEAIALLLGRGIAVTICTGRMYSGVRDVARSLGLRAPVACVDGSYIVDCSRDEPLLRVSIDHEIAVKAVALLARFELAAFLFFDDWLLHDHAGAAFLSYVAGWSPRARLVQSVSRTLSDEADTETMGLVAVGDPRAIVPAAQQIRSLGGDAIQVDAFAVSTRPSGASWALLVRAAGVSKGTAVKWLARHYGLSLAEVVAVGDWVNDIPMMRAVGRSFAMAQSPTLVKAAATDELEADCYQGGGLAEAAARCGLL